MFFRSIYTIITKPYIFIVCDNFFTQCTVLVQWDYCDRIAIPIYLQRRVCCYMKFLADGLRYHYSAKLINLYLFHG